MVFFVAGSVTVTSFTRSLAEAHRLIRRHPAEIDHRRDEPGRAEHGRARALRQLRHVARMVAVAVGHEDPVDLAKRVEVLVLRSITITLPVSVVIFVAA